MSNPETRICQANTLPLRYTSLGLLWCFCCCFVFFFNFMVNVYVCICVCRCLCEYMYVCVCTCIHPFVLRGQRMVLGVSYLSVSGLSEHGGFSAKLEASKPQPLTAEISVYRDTLLHGHHYTLMSSSADPLLLPTPLLQPSSFSSSSSSGYCGFGAVLLFEKTHCITGLLLELPILLPQPPEFWATAMSHHTWFLCVFQCTIR